MGVAKAIDQFFKTFSLLERVEIGSLDIFKVAEKKALEMLPQEKFLGFVMNRQKDALGNKYYGYYK